MLSIGDFARLAGVSVRMLRHYDRLGLVSAARVDPHTGYRFYEPRQLQRVHALIGLKDLGFTLEQIGPMLAGQIDTETFRELLDRRRAALREQIDADHRRLADVERHLRLMEGNTVMEFIEKSLPALELSQRTATVADRSQIGPVIGPMFEELVAAQIEAGGQPAHPAYAWYRADGERLDFGAGFDTEIDGFETGELDAVERAVTVTYVGPMSGIGDAWAELGTHVASLGLEPYGPCREVYLDTNGPQEKWVTELHQPVRG
ncbi:MerR family transcriptional regulator [Yimella sp. RIT 621]|uniref:DNA-binding transcriptional MerR regulator n=1 Tax=Yimella lutea TaxID=587872 RepID=A0A542ED06_9MICO|nr:MULTISPECIES: MerR family transcriptional regulator [Yimella]RYG78546.1 MerR family transcriptional regulator [Yimella sp. RIT 621]TQJ13213.1 DNA-binding transcriptional MerR regulator [Yimella lutea]